MAYVESDTALPTHHKTKSVARKLGCRRSEVVGCLQCLWAWATDNAPDGNITGFEADVIAEEADWPGDADTFVSALIDAGKLSDDRVTRSPGFLERTPDGRLVIHDWWTQGGGKLIVSREREAYRIWYKRNTLSDTIETYQRWLAASRRSHNAAVPYQFIGANITEPTPDVDPQSTPSGGHSDDMPSMLNNVGQHTADVGTKKRVEKSREEESREEKIREDKTTQDAGAGADVGVSPSRKVEPLPLPEDWLPGPELVAWAETEYPQVDLRQATGNFVDHWLNVAGKDGKKLDWGRTWKNNIRTYADKGWYLKKPANGYNPSAPRNGPYPRRDAAAESIARVLDGAERAGFFDDKQMSFAGQINH